MELGKNLDCMFSVEGKHTLRKLRSTFLCTCMVNAGIKLVTKIMLVDDVYWRITSFISLQKIHCAKTMLQVTMLQDLGTG